MKSRWPQVCACAIVVLALSASVIPPTRAAAGEPNAADDALALTATIDRLIAAGWAESKTALAAPADDAEFLRRVTLDLTGRIPTVAEARQFLGDSSPDKRRRLVDRLLESKAYVAHMATTERQRLIPEASTPLLTRFLVPSLEGWLREQIAANAGYDRIVRALITAPVAEPNAPGTAGIARFQKPSPLPFIVAKEVKSENLAASTARLFLGLRLECAQCHNHPFATWTREQFWGYAAFFASLESPGPNPALAAAIRERRDRRELTIPGTQKVVPATFLDGSEPVWLEKGPAREVLADWMTAAGNPYFARATVNRMWAQLFGAGLVEPVDDMGADNPASHPELLDALAGAFAAHEFDRKWLLRAIALSRPYQLTSTAPHRKPSADAGNDRTQSRDFAVMAVRGLSAEQLYDSLLEAAGMPLVEPKPPTRPGQVQVVRNPTRDEFLEKFNRQAEKPAEVQMSILQELALMNGAVVSAVTRPGPNLTGTTLTKVLLLDPADGIETLFLAALSRRPTDDESEWLVGYVVRGALGDRRKAFSDIFWALLNSPEFLFNH